MKTHAYGFPRLGKNREYKKALESFWAGKLDESGLRRALSDIESARMRLYAGIDGAAGGETSLYDFMADAVFMFGIEAWRDAQGYYDYCRGVHAPAMTKYFNTNYHYLRPRLEQPRFSFAWDKYAWLGVEGSPLKSCIGPFTFLRLSQSQAPLADYVPPLAEAYAAMFEAYPSSDFQLEEPGFVLDLSPEEKHTALDLYARLGKYLPRIICLTYYDAVDAPALTGLGFKALGLDFVHGRGNFDSVRRLCPGTVLIAGLIDGRNIFKKDDLVITAAVARIADAVKNEIRISNAAPLFHLPYSVENEKQPEIRTGFSFAVEKLAEITACRGIDPRRAPAAGAAPHAMPDAFVFPASERAPYDERKKRQQDLGLPLFPTTTIGSFPQSETVRRTRNQFRKGEMDAAAYRRFIFEQIDQVIRYQEEKGYDVLVHGEFERSDMVEFFAEKLEGILCTEAGWVISYGSRVYRPPIIVGDVSRPAPMTLPEIAYAQSRTKKPVKGMLTGPVTIIAWSFVNPAVPIEKIAWELARALNDEVKDYLSAGIRIIQIDEPAFRERAPVKKRDWPVYFDWAVKAFKTAASSPPEAQIHTHMCYSAFDEIIGEIEKLDADVISIEAARSRGEIVRDFEAIGYRRGIGIGVWDIHSPRSPSAVQMREAALRALEKLPRESIWINPDCGLKTRTWEEIDAPLQAIPRLAGELRLEAGR
jgi:5-methyltetrahydropteroyltriglutamate--homocysteine methyltransferase